MLLKIFKIWVLNFNSKVKMSFLKDLERGPFLDAELI